MTEKKPFFNFVILMGIICRNNHRLNPTSTGTRFKEGPYAYVPTRPYIHDMRLLCGHTSSLAYLPTRLQAYAPTGLRAYMSARLHAYTDTRLHGLRAYKPTQIRAYRPTRLRAYALIWTGGKFAVAGQQITSASRIFFLLLKWAKTSFWASRLGRKPWMCKNLSSFI